MNNERDKILEELKSNIRGNDPSFLLEAAITRIVLARAETMRESDKAHALWAQTERLRPEVNQLSKLKSAVQDELAEAEFEIEVLNDKCLRKDAQIDQLKASQIEIMRETLEDQEVIKTLREQLQNLKRVVEAVASADEADGISSIQIDWTNTGSDGQVYLRMWLQDAAKRALVGVE